jgi:serine/threonine-protein kinase
VTGLDLAEPVLNEVVAGKYRLTRLIGRGGMGSVWEGVHLTLDTRVAVKFIDPTYAESPEARQRFENEARAAARLNSKYAVQVYDHGVMPDGRPFIVMEFLVGEPLDARLDREGRISPQETARIVSQVCRALSRAHSAGIVHRDLKPENVFLVWDEEDQENVAKVVDFGIAKFTDNQIGVSSSTRTGSVLGTPYYMSPEQARGLRSVDYRTDLWSLGVIAFRCIVGRLPFEGESVGDLLVKICTIPLPIPSEVAPGCPPAFDTWFQRALQRDPSQRFVTAQELAEQLMLACGLALGRQAMASGALGDAAEYARAGYGHLGNATPNGAVASVTAAQGDATNSVFARSGQAMRGRSKPLIWGAVGAVVVIAVALAAVLARKAPATPALADPSQPGKPEVVAGPVTAPATPTPTVSVDVVPAVAAPLAPMPSANSVDESPKHGAASPVRPSKPSGVAPQPARPSPPVATPRRPAASRPIDVGY